MKTLALLLIALLVSPSAEAAFKLRESIIKPKTFLVPSVTYHFGLSELAGSSSSISHGPMAGLRYKVLKDSVFFAPDVSYLALLALDKSPLSILSLGFVAGGHLDWGNLELFGGLSYRIPFSYKASGAAFGRVGASWGAPESSSRIVFEANYGKFTEVQATQKIAYPYLAVELGAEFPMAL